MVSTRGASHMFRRRISWAVTVAAVAAICLGFVGSANGASSVYPMSVRFGGADGRVDTLAKVRAALLSQHTTRQMLRFIKGLSPADRRYVIEMGLESAYTTYAKSPTVTVKRGPFDIRAVVSGCSGYSDYYGGFHANDFSYAHILLWTFHSEWWWNGCYGHVWQWSHSEWPTYGSIPGWSYQGEVLGRTYGGRPGSFMVGREMFGQFQYVSFLVGNTADLQVQVNGRPGWWSWANVTGP